MLMNAEKFNSFSLEDQRSILEAAHDAALWQRKDAEDADKADTKFLKENGMNYYTPDMELWEAAVMPMYDKYPEWKEVVDKIKKFK